MGFLLVTFLIFISSFFVSCAGDGTTPYFDDEDLFSYGFGNRIWTNHALHPTDNSPSILKYSQDALYYQKDNNTVAQVIYYYRDIHHQTEDKVVIFYHYYFEGRINSTTLRIRFVPYDKKTISKDGTTYPLTDIKYESYYKISNQLRDEIFTFQIASDQERAILRRVSSKDIDKYH